MFSHVNLPVVTLVSSVGALGIWALGSLLMPALASSDHAFRAERTERVTTAPLALSPAGGSVERVQVTIPSVVYGPSDALPATLSRGATYTATVMALSTEPALNTSVTVSAKGATVSGCVSQPLTAGVVQRLECPVTVTDGATRMTLVVTARGSDGSRVLHTYAHSVTGN